MFIEVRRPICKENLITVYSPLSASESNHIFRHAESPFKCLTSVLNLDDNEAVKSPKSPLTGKREQAQEQETPSLLDELTEKELDTFSPHFPPLEVQLFFCFGV